MTVAKPAPLGNHFGEVIANLYLFLVDLGEAGSPLWVTSITERNRPAIVLSRCREGSAGRRPPSGCHQAKFEQPKETPDGLLRS